MSRIILKTLNPIFFCLMAMIITALQTTVFSSFPLMYLQPDFILLGVIWSAYRRSFTEGGILTLIFSNIAEIHSSVPSGIFMISYMALYLLTRLTQKYLVVSSFSSLITFTLTASIIQKILWFFVLKLLGVPSGFWRHLFALMLPGAVMVGVFSVWVYRFLEKFDQWTFKDSKVSQRLDQQTEGDIVLN